MANEVRNFLLGNALFWLEKYHLDGLRVDAGSRRCVPGLFTQKNAVVAQHPWSRENLEAVDFVKKFNELVHQHHPVAKTFAEDPPLCRWLRGPPMTAGSDSITVEHGMDEYTLSTSRWIRSTESIITGS